MPFGLQLFSVAKELREDLEGTLGAIADIGFRHVQPAGLHGQSAARLGDAIRAAGLECHSIHLPLRPQRPGELSLTDLPAVVDASRAIGFSRVVVPMFPLPEQVAVPKTGETLEAFILRAATAIGIDHWPPFAATLNRIGAELAAQGLRLGYHNHNLEFARVDGTSGYDILLAETDPALVDFELDVGWARSAGCDPAALLRQRPTRFGSLHLKDLAASTPINTRFQLHPADPGEGTVDWPSLFGAANALGIGERLIEREPPFTEPPLATLRRHWRQLSAFEAS